MYFTNTADEPQKPTPASKPRGRPSIVTADIEHEIIERVSNGETLLKICKSKHMPHRATIIRWKHSNSAFAARYARARIESADAVDEKIMQVADDCTNDTAQGDRVKIDAYKWRAANLNREIYGDIKNVNVSGTVTLEALIMGTQAKEPMIIDGAVSDVTPEDDKR